MSPELPKVVRVHEATVQAAAREPPRRRRKRRTWAEQAEGAIVGELTSIKVREDVWAEARRLAGPNPRHIQILNDEECIVWNHGPPWPERKPHEPRGDAD